MTAMFSWTNMMNLFNVFDVRVSFSLIRENMGTLLSVSTQAVPFHCKWFEPRSISSLLSVIVQVSIVLKRTVVVDND